MTTFAVQPTRVTFAATSKRVHARLHYLAVAAQGAPANVARSWPAEISTADQELYRRRTEPREHPLEITPASRPMAPAAEPAPTSILETKFPNG